MRVNPRDKQIHLAAAKASLQAQEVHADGRDCRCNEHGRNGLVRQ